MKNCTVKTAVSSSLLRLRLPTLCFFLPSHWIVAKQVEMAVSTKAPAFSAAIRKWAYNLSGFNKYGLHHDDCLYETEDVKEALRRLPERVVDERNFRINRALHLSMSKITLPKAEWTQFEQDNRYLKPYLEEVVKERMEREEWNKA